MRYNQYLYRLPVQAVPITDIVKNSISSADIVTDPIIGTSLQECRFNTESAINWISLLVPIGTVFVNPVTYTYVSSNARAFETFIYDHK